MSQPARIPEQDLRPAEVVGAADGVADRVRGHAQHVQRVGVGDVRHGEPGQQVHDRGVADDHAAVGMADQDDPLARQGGVLGQELVQVRRVGRQAAQRVGGAAWLGVDSKLAKPMSTAKTAVTVRAGLARYDVGHRAGATRALACWTQRCPAD